MRKPTLKDVARLAGVSTATVSYAVNQTRSVSTRSREKIEAAIRQLGYQPNLAARSFKSGKRNTIGFIVPDIANLYFSVIIEEIEAVLASKDMNLIVANTKEDPGRELQQVSSLSNGLVDGLIIAPVQNQYDMLGELLPDRFPVVLIDRGIPACDLDQILIESQAAMQKGVSRLVDEGHRQIGFIADQAHIHTAQQRVKEFEKACICSGISPDPALIRHITAENSSVRHHALDLIGNGCTAIVAGNNMITAELVSVALNQHFEGNTPLQILGYHCGEWYAWLPFLKMISVPAREMGRLAADRLLKRMTEPDLPSKEYFLACR